MAGHWGAERIRVQSLLVVDVLPDLEVILVKGSVPGHPKGILIVEKSRIANRKSQRLKLNRIKHIPENLLRSVQ
jgi:large subunit ribosomal protein L3